MFKMFKDTLYVIYNAIYNLLKEVCRKWKVNYKKFKSQVCDIYWKKHNFVIEDLYKY